MPTVLPWIEGAASLFGVVDTVSQQNQAASAQQAADQNQTNLLSQAVTTAQTPNVTPILQAAEGATNTLQSNIGGVANPGALIKSLYGGDLSNAMSAAANASNPVGTELSAAGQYGQVGAAAGKAESGTSLPGLIGAVGSAAGGAFNAINKGTGSPNTAGPGTVNDPGMSGTTPSPLNQSGQVTTDPYYGSSAGTSSLNRFTPGPSSGFVPQTSQ